MEAHDDNGTVRTAGFGADEASATVVYTGEALRNGRMDVEDLAPALLAFARSIRSAQRVVNPGKPSPSIQIHATREGSFAIELMVTAPVIKDAWDQAAAALSSDPANAAANLTTLLSLVTAAIRLLTRHGRKSFSPSESHDGCVTLTLEDGTSLTVDGRALDLVKDAGFREGVRDLVRPLNKDGVDSVSISGAAGSATIEKNDVPALELPDLAREELLDTEVTVNLQLEQVAFSDRLKWRVSEGGQTYTVSVEDLPFLSRVESGEISFSANDILQVRMRVRQYRDRHGSLKAERSIIEVQKHIDGGRQVPFSFD